MRSLGPKAYVFIGKTHRERPRRPENTHLQGPFLVESSRRKRKMSLFGMRAFAPKNVRFSVIPLVRARSDLSHFCLLDAKNGRKTPFSGFQHSFRPIFCRVFYLGVPENPVKNGTNLRFEALLWPLQRSVSIGKPRRNANFAWSEMAVFAFRLELSQKTGLRLGPRKAKLAVFLQGFLLFSNVLSWAFLWGFRKVAFANCLELSQKQVFRAVKKHGICKSPRTFAKNRGSRSPSWTPFLGANKGRFCEKSRAFAQNGLSCRPLKGPNLQNA